MGGDRQETRSLTGREEAIQSALQSQVRLEIGWAKTPIGKATTAYP